MGKTSLVNRLVALLNLSKQFYRFNLSDTEWDIKMTLSEIYDNHGDPNFIILLDEFQYVRTITEDGKEKSSKHVITMRRMTLLMDDFDGFPDLIDAGSNRRL